MQFIDLISRINNLTDQEEVSAYFRAIRHDPIIWGGFQRLSLDEKIIARLIDQDVKMDAGTLALVSIYPDFNFSQLLKNPYPRELLEKIMFEYESYLQAEAPVDAFEKSAILAAALIEKHKVTKRWKNVITEVISRMHIDTAEKFERFWQTVIAIVINITGSREELLFDLLDISESQLSLGVFLHTVMCLPLEGEKLVEVFEKNLGTQSVKTQSLALKRLQEISNKSLVKDLAHLLLEKYKSMDTHSEGTSVYWENPETSLNFALQCQAASDIADFADEKQIALDLTNKSIEIISAIGSIGKIKKSALLGEVEELTETGQQFSESDLEQQDIIDELVFADNEFDTQVQPDKFIYTIKVLQQSKRMSQAGNREIADEELKRVIRELSDAEMEQLLVKGPRFSHVWDPSDVLDTLVEAKAYEEAIRLSDFLLKKNPTNLTVNYAAAKASEALGNFASAESKWELLRIMQPDSPEIRRNLANIYRKNGKNEKALEIYNEFLSSQANPVEKDLLTVAEISLDLGKYEESENALNRVLENDAENPIALSLVGIVKNHNGETDLALDYLRKAIEISGNDSRAWITISDILAKSGKNEEALDTLRAGIAANPDNKDLRVSYVVRLMNCGFVVEAYPLLRELSESGVDENIDELLIEAMKNLGIEDLNGVLENMLERHHDNFNFMAEYGKNLVWSGQTEKGLEFLKTVKNHITLKPDWAIAYAEGSIGANYSHSISKEKLTALRLAEIHTLIDEVQKQDPFNKYAKVLKGEFLLRNNQYNKAFHLFSEILDQHEETDGILFERINAGLAQSAAGLGRFEIAQAAIKEATDLKPEWVGLRQLQAEIVKNAGDTGVAIKLARGTLEIAPDEIENIKWFVNFMQHLGNDHEVEKVLAERMEKQPNNLDLHLVYAEQKINNKELTIPNSLLERIKGLVQTTDEPTYLIRAGALFEKNNDRASALFCLNKAAETGDLDAKLNLAGFLRNHGELEKSLEILNAISETQNTIAILKSEIEYISGNIDTAYSLLPEASVEVTQFTFDPVFLPVGWSEVFQSSSPTRSARLSYDLKSGRHEGSLKLAREWFSEDSTNMEARVYGIEIALACGSEEDYSRFIDGNPGFEQDIFSIQFQFLKAENELEVGDTNKALSIAGQMNENEPDSMQSRILQLRILANEGNLSQAESLLEVCLNDNHSLNTLPFAVMLGIQRSLIHNARKLNRWEEANGICRSICSETKANEEIEMLAFQNFVYGIEFHNSAQHLEIEKHEAIKFFGIENLKVEMERLQSALNGKKVEEVKRLTLHGKLAIEPNQENIRALALVVPGPEDAAAMMAALRVLNQSNTAIQIARKFIDHPRVMFELALCLEHKDITKAIEIIRKSTQKYPHQALAYRLLSYLLEKNEDLEGAAATIEEAINYWTNEPKWHTKAAEIWSSLGSTDKPLEHLKYAEELSPEDHEIQFKLGKAYIAAREPGYALKHLDNASKAVPNRADIFEEISDAYLLAGDFDQALSASEKASVVDPFAVKPHLQAGKVHWSKGELAKAIDQVKLAISLNQDDADSYVFLARLLKEQGEKLKSLEALEKASKCKFANVLTIIEHAELLKEINGAAAARDLIESLSRKFPENPELLRLLAEAEEECGNLKQAETNAKRVLEMQPNQPSIHRFLGKIQERNGNLDQAAHYFSQAIAYNPADTEGYLSLSKAFAKQREFEKAKKVLEEGMLRAPEDIRLYLACAVLLKDSKDYRGAEQILRRASVIDPRNLNVHRQLGAVLALNLVHQSQEVSSHI